MTVTISFGREVYSCGGICTALLSLNNNDSNSSNNKIQNSKGYSIYVQSFGQIQIDSRWVKEDINQCNNIFKQEFLYPNDINLTKLPKLDNKNYYIFVTSREKYLSINGNDEICIYFDLPDDLLPSYKGLCAVINYYITITIINQNNSERSTLQFPYQVVGKCNLPISPHYIKHSVVAVMPSQSWPKDLHLQPLPDMLSVGFDKFCLSNEDENELIPVVYNIRDEDIVCSLTLLQNNSTDICIKMYPYQVVCLTLDFHLAKQPCHAVRARLIQYEKKTDGSRVQDKVLHSTMKSTKDALTVHMQLKTPRGIPCEFITPVFQLTYLIELEFLIEKNGMIQSEPFTWNLPVSIIIPSGINNISAEINSCMEPVTVHHSTIN